MNNRRRRRKPARTTPPRRRRPGNAARIGTRSSARQQLRQRGQQFNPAMGIILNGAYRAYEHNPRTTPSRLSLGRRNRAAGPGLQYRRIGIRFTANVDDWFFSRVTAAIEQEDGDFNTSIEAFLDTLSLPANTTCASAASTPRWAT